MLMFLLYHFCFFFATSVVKLFLSVIKKIEKDRFTIRKKQSFFLILYALLRLAKGLLFRWASVLR